MLHILWLILKFILIVLGILLGLLLLAVLLILFCPVRYRASAVKSEGGLKEIEGEGIVSWLFHGVSLKAEWKDQQLNLAFHLLGIPVDKLMKKRQERKTKSQKETKTKAKKTKASVAEIKDKTKDNAKNNAKDEQQKVSAAEKIRNSPDGISDETSEKVPDEISEKKIFFIKKIYNRLQNIFKSIRVKFRNIKKTFSRMKKQASWWKAFIEHPRVKAARDLVWKHAKFLLKHIFPTRIEGEVTFSFEDPALTGAALAVLGMTIPFHKNCVQINPQFDGENYLQGNIKVKGRIYGFVFVRAIVGIYFDKNIKYVIKRWKTRRA